jgi:hypothetical protein
MMRGARFLWMRHRAFTVLLIPAAALRLVMMLGYRPARLYWYDSVTYLRLAEHPAPNQVFDPSGYPLLVLLPLRPLHSLVLVVAVQHLLGLATGALVYALLRRRGVPAWLAVTASAPELLDASYFSLEHAILGDTLFIFLVVAGTTALLWSPRPSVRAGAAGALLLALAAVTRTAALPLVAVALAWLALRRAGWRVAVAACVAAAVPIVAYAGWYSQTYGRFTVVGGDGLALWARTMPFADCRVIHPPRAEAVLCPNGVKHDATGDYVWDSGSSLGRFAAHTPGGMAADDGRARSFALHAIEAQPLDYLRSVAADVSLAFHWDPARHPKRVTPAFGIRDGTWPLGHTDDPGVRAVLAGYAGGPGTERSVEPFSGVLHVYQYPAYLRGPMLAAILLLGGCGLATRGRRALLPWAFAVCLLVLPVAALDFDHRYVLPVVPLACMAAALAAADLRWTARPFRDAGAGGAERRLAAPTLTASSP